MKVTDLIVRIEDSSFRSGDINEIFCENLDGECFEIKGINGEILSTDDFCDFYLNGENINENIIKTILVMLDNSIHISVDITGEEVVSVVVVEHRNAVWIFRNGRMAKYNGRATHPLIKVFAEKFLDDPYTRAIDIYI